MKKQFYIIFTAIILCSALTACTGKENPPEATIIKYETQISVQQTDYNTAESTTEISGQISNDELKTIFQNLIPDIKKADDFACGKINADTQAEQYIFSVDDLLGGEMHEIPFVPVNEDGFETTEDMKTFFLNTFTENYIKEKYYFVFQDYFLEYQRNNGYDVQTAQSIYIDNDEGRLYISLMNIKTENSYIDWDIETISDIKEKDNQISFLINGISADGETIPGNFLLENTDDLWRVSAYQSNYYNLGNIFL